MNRIIKVTATRWFRLGKLFYRTVLQYEDLENYILLELEVRTKTVTATIKLNKMFVQTENSQITSQNCAYYLPN